MGGNSGGLVDREKRRVFVENFDRNVGIGQESRGFDRRAVQPNLFAALDDLALAGAAPVDLGAIGEGLAPILPSAAREMLDQEEIEA